MQIPPPHPLQDYSQISVSPDMGVAGLFSPLGAWGGPRQSCSGWTFMVPESLPSFHFSDPDRGPPGLGRAI